MWGPRHAIGWVGFTGKDYFSSTFSRWCAASTLLRGQGAVVAWWPSQLAVWNPVGSDFVPNPSMMWSPIVYLSICTSLFMYYDFESLINTSFISIVETFVHRPPPSFWTEKAVTVLWPFLINKVQFSFRNFQALVADIMRLTGDVQAVVMAGGKVERSGNLRLAKQQCLFQVAI